jgi:hypothetical protein
VVNRQPEMTFREAVLVWWRIMGESIETLARRFRRFGERECVPASPLYARLSIGIAGDEQLLQLATAARAHPIPNLFFGAVHYLLLGGIHHRLAAFYPDLAGVAPDPHDPFPAFRSFCLEHASAIEGLLATRRVQTNEVRRCAALLPAFTLLARRGGQRPLALVEIGASAGLNLLWDRYAYDYGPGGRAGDPYSAVRLRCELRGDRRPPLPDRLPDVAFRLGLDLSPIDVRDADATLWLRALIWPEQIDRAAHLSHALAIAQQNPPPLLAGDALTLLPDVFARAPREATLCLYHSFVLNQFPAPARDRFHALLAEHAAARDFAVVGIEWREPYPPVTLTTFENGSRLDETLAFCDAHVAWLEWRQ